MRDTRIAKIGDNLLGELVATTPIRHTHTFVGTESRIPELCMDHTQVHLSQIYRLGAPTYIACRKARKRAYE